ncbi:hypothetical protein SAMN05428975_3992 [Mucilaginibacter sp. OK268]|uniref:hypothetical protein n=1 Tax=Mucilaginibacter sp. OK268 TaxID=1881048 RepID=UPI00088E66DC|nr:hypothetical protein [Mucilaginibacter sp. OK268]SDP94770.1 hypothetical protein SAMN05428975_3992 [Mucilaginibacter sp. OK268]
MNKRILFKLIFLILLAFPGITYAQYTVDNVGSTQRPFYLVGSLPPDDLGNYQKLQIDVLGGGWGNNTLGVTTYYVGNRGGLTIHQTTQGSGATSFGIKAYANPNGNTDIYIIITQDYPAISIKSFKLPSNNGQLQAIVQQAPIGTDVTPVLLPVMITDANGNIALNTYDSKGYKFAVNGSAIATSMTVKLNSAWPDYVFKKDYQLPSLSDVKAYIDQNQHLPEIPSEQQIAKEGLNLGEMNKLLMKKVEELTLYLIEKDKKEKELETRIKSLEQKSKN